jgi:hypothetical protein
MQKQQLLLLHQLHPTKATTTHPPLLLQVLQQEYFLLIVSLRPGKLQQIKLQIMQMSETAREL